MKFITDLPIYQEIKKELIAKGDFKFLSRILDLSLECFNLGLDTMRNIIKENK